nr:hypothetical protein [Kibdelosporangium sp. MJ126-NF4]CTQ98547.1 hypothetical protein [Kibdelosporangium sp. MJ126-NF4]
MPKCGSDRRFSLAGNWMGHTSMSPMCRGHRLNIDAPAPE